MPESPIIGCSVQIRGGIGEFGARVGKIIACEGDRYRVRLVVPVNIAGVGEVKEHLFARGDFRLLRRDPRHARDGSLKRC
jgi:hypothetical protein